MMASALVVVRVVCSNAAGGSVVRPVSRALARCASRTWAGLGSAHDEPEERGFLQAVADQLFYCDRPGPSCGRSFRWKRNQRLNAACRSPNHTSVSGSFKNACILESK